MEVFNRCAQTQNVMLTLECWKDVHPSLVTIPVEWHYSIPFGILYAKNPSADILKFLEILRTHPSLLDQANLPAPDSKDK